MKDRPTQQEAVGELKPFFAKLKKVHRVPKVTSYNVQQLETHPELRKYAGEVQELQTYATAGDHVQYEEKRRALERIGLSFRQTKGEVYLTRNEGETVDVEVAVQVKGNSLTWYFWADGAMDQYPQEFRDRLYNQAAQAHKHVDAGCDLYYRGSNSYHLKNMHHVVSESAHNHNHYRLANDKHYTPHDFEQHLRAFSGSPIHDEFFEMSEIDQLCGEFAEFHADWTSKVDGHPSKEELYFQQASQRYNRGDMIELQLFGTMQEPCPLCQDSCHP